LKKRVGPGHKPHPGNIAWKPLVISGLERNVEKSADLRVWTAIATNALRQGSIYVPQPPTSGAAFFLSVQTDLNCQASFTA